MGGYVLWPTRKNYRRFREVMDDGHEFPVGFDQWEINAKRAMARAKEAGITIKPVSFNPDKFTAFCEGRKIPRDSKARALFAMAEKAAHVPPGTALS